MARDTAAKVFLIVVLATVVQVVVAMRGCGSGPTKISCVAFSPDGTRLAVARHDGRYASTFRPSKEYLADIHRTVSVLRVPSLETESVIERDDVAGPVPFLYNFAPDSLAFNQTSDELAVLAFTDGFVSFYGLAGSVKRVLVPDEVAANLQSSHGRTMFATTYWSNVTLWDAATGKKRRTIETDLEPPTHRDAALVAFSSDDRLIAVAGRERVTLWNTTTGAKRAEFTHPTEGWSWSLAASPARRQLAIGSSTWARVYDFEGNQIAEFSPPHRVFAICFAPDGDEVAAGTGRGVHVFDARTGVSVRDLRAGKVSCVAYSPDGTYLAVGGGHGRVSLWDAATGKLVAEVQPPGRRFALMLLWPSAAGALLLLECGVSAYRRRVRSRRSASDKAGTAFGT